jgi:hypothetical protein
VKVVSFTVRATLAQSERWKRAADAEGYASAGGWLADAADAYLKARARAGRPLPLAWRKGHCRVSLDGGDLVVKGFVSPPFFAFRGTTAGHNRMSNQYTLTLQASGRIVATLATYAQCRALAAEIAPTLLRGELPDAGPIVERHVREQA